MEKENKTEEKANKIILTKQELNELVKQASIRSNLALLSEISQIIAAMHKSLIDQVQPINKESK